MHFFVSEDMILPIMKCVIICTLLPILLLQITIYVNGIDNTNEDANGFNQATFMLNM